MIKQSNGIFLSKIRSTINGGDLLRTTDTVRFLIMINPIFRGSIVRFIQCLIYTMSGLDIFHCVISNKTCDSE